MADKRKPEGRIIIESPTSRVAVELFPASLFPGGEQFDGQYRVRIGRRWLRSTGQRYVYLTYAEVFGWLISMSEQVMPSCTPGPCQEEPRPDLPKGSPVCVENGHVTPAGLRLRDRTFTMTDPFQGVDGQWRVFLVGRREPVIIKSLFY